MKLLIALTFLFATSAAFAQSNCSNNTPRAKWEVECGNCHIAYPPRFLSSTDWQRMMSSLDKHFGTNAELDAEDFKIISNYLQRNSANREQRMAKTLRISDTPWFKEDHSEVPKRVWSNPPVKSPSNCAACHVHAEEGDWSEIVMQMPVKLKPKLNE